ncbi:MAG: hypothetical protein EP298_11035 [Gammaproteobacteria bacterium]|nr:MAG: hypothetical protein EP298_11035 [Gammaproteobacteria bacterium]UTW43519.1 hypothetical protein KFE69_05355 [bacterium SCSIO 12844]
MKSYVKAPGDTVNTTNENPNFNPNKQSSSLDNKKQAPTPFCNKNDPDLIELDKHLEDLIRFEK